MHIAEFMGGKAARQAQPGTLGSGGAVRVPDSKRNLHLKNTEEGPQGSDEEEGKGKKVVSHDSPKRKSQRHKGSKGSTRCAQTDEQQFLRECFLFLFLFLLLLLLLL